MPNGWTYSLDRYKDIIHVYMYMYTIAMHTYTISDQG